MTEGFEQVKAQFQRSPTKRLAAVFELDRRFAYKLFGETVHPNHIHLLRIALQEWTAASGDEHLASERHVIEHFVNLCSPTDAPADRYKTAGQFLLLVVELNNRIEAASPEEAGRLVGLVEQTLANAKLETAALPSNTKSLLELTADFRDRITQQALDDGYEGNKAQLIRFFASFGKLLRSLILAKQLKRRDPLPIPVPAEAIVSWIQMWTALGYPSDPFLSEHHADPIYVKLLELTADVIRLTQDVSIAFALTQPLPPSPEVPKKDAAPQQQQHGLTVPPFGLIPCAPQLQEPCEDENAVCKVMKAYQGVGVTDAVELVVAMVEHKVDDFFSSSDALACIEADPLWYIEFLKKAARGHWLLTAHLAGLPPVSSPISPRIPCDVGVLPAPVSPQTYLRRH